MTSSFQDVAEKRGLTIELKTGGLRVVLHGALDGIDVRQSHYGHILITRGVIGQSIEITRTCLGERLGSLFGASRVRTSSRAVPAAGFRNRDPRALLHPRAATLPPVDQHRLAAKISRKLRPLRAHGLLKKAPRTQRHLLTERGHLLTAALRATRDANIKHLLREAA